MSQSNSNLSAWFANKIATMNTAHVAPYGLIENGAIVTDKENIVWVGTRAQWNTEWQSRCTQSFELGKVLVTPGLIDCHTHLVYAGHRAKEFELRLEGASYEQIALSGGGINSTVQATRMSTEQELFEQSQRRLLALIAQGVTTVEIKSGYGLNLETERKMLTVARRLQKAHDISIKTTYLGAHATPPEYKGQTQLYFDEVVLPCLRQLHREGLVDAVDAFCETIGFNIDQTRNLFELAHELGLPIKLHAEQLSDSGGSQLAASFKSLSCDHLEWLSPAGIAAMAANKTVAVLLPVAFYFLRETRVPPIAALRAAQIPMAVSTDCNPGSSPCAAPLLALNMACTLFRLTPQEALQGMTQHAARALGLNDRGTISANKRADFATWAVDHPAELCYGVGMNPLVERIVGAQRP